MFYRCVDAVLYPATPLAQRWTVRTALYIAPEGLYRLDWTLVERRGGPDTSLKVWRTPLPRPPAHV